MNPSEEHYQSEFKVYRENNPDSYMVYFKNMIGKCTDIVYLPFKDGMIGAGIWYEVHQVDPDHIYEIDLPNNDIKKVSLEHVDDRKLSIEDTRVRIKKDFNDITVS